MRDLILSHNGIFLIGRAEEKKGSRKGQVVESITRHIPLEQIELVSLVKSFLKIGKISVQLIFYFEK